MKERHPWTRPILANSPDATEQVKQAGKDSRNMKNFNELKARLKLKTEGVLYEEPYERRFGEVVVEIIGHDGSNYVAVLNNQIKIITPKDYNVGEHNY